MCCRQKVVGSCGRSFYLQVEGGQTVGDLGELLLARAFGAQQIKGLTRSKGNFIHSEITK